MNRKKSQTFEKKSNNVIRYEKVNRLKQLGFTTSWNICDQKKDYNALEDPHADRYFRYQSVKMHMKDLRRSLGKAQINETEKKKLTRLIKQKLSDHLPAIKVAAETYNISPNQLDKSKMSQTLTKQKSLTEVGKHHKKSKKKKDSNKNHNATDLSIDPHTQLEDIQRQITNEIRQNSQKQKVHTENNLMRKSQKLLRQEDRKQAEKKQYLRKQQQLLHKKKHEEFISFIAKKKETIQPANTAKQ